MFENKQDTTILRDSLISAARYLQNPKESKGNSSNSDEETAVQIVASSVKSFTCNLYGVESFQELFKNQQSINRRFHAVIFINLLKAQNITSSEASSFYQSVLRDLPILNWSFYLKLNFASQWSEYFAECAKQLPTEVLSTVLKKFLEVQLDGELKYYVWHLVLQALVLKTFEPHFSTLNSVIQQCSFQFQFNIPDSYHSEVQDNMKKSLNLSLIHTILLEELFEDYKKNLNINFVKVIFHGFKTLFRLISSINSEKELSLEHLELLTPIFGKCLTRETMKTLICENFIGSDSNTIASNYQIISWEINMMYLLFVLQNSWKDMSKQSSSSGIKNKPKMITEYCTKFHSHMKQINLSYDVLLKMNEECLKSSNDAEKNHLKLLIDIIQYHYPYASRAAEHLLTKPSLWDQYNVLNLLEENVSLLEPMEIFSVLIDVIPKADNCEKQNRLLKMFFLLLSQASTDIYNLAIQKILKKWGYCDYFVCSDFNLLLTQFSRFSMSVEVESLILPLFVQSPFTVLKTLIGEVMMQGSDRLTALQVLKRVPIVCLYQGKTEDIAPLVDIISTHFQKVSEEQNTKNFFLLIKSLMEIQVTEDILSFDLFFETCIVPNLSTSDLNQLEITLTCLNVALDVLIPKHALEISEVNYVILIKHLGKILEYCIENGVAKVKETVFHTLELISKFKKRPDLDSLFYGKSINAENMLSIDKEEIILYILGIFFNNNNSGHPKEVKLLQWKNDVVEKKLENLWIWCTITKDINAFVDKIPMYDLSYIHLLKTLTPLLYHFTMSEWLYSTKLIMYSRDLLKSDVPSYPWLLSANDPELYGVIRCLIDCFTMMQEKSSMTNLYISNCLTTTIRTLITKANVPPSLLLNIFIDVCCLYSHIEEELFYVFSSALISLRKQFLTVSDSLQKKDGLALMKLGLQCLPDSEEKESLKEKVSLPDPDKKESLKEKVSVLDSKEREN